MCCHSVGCGYRRTERKPKNDAISYTEFPSRSRDAVIRLYDAAGNMIETREHKGDFKEP